MKKPSSTFIQAHLHLYPGPAPPLTRPSSTFIQAQLHLYPGPAPPLTRPSSTFNQAQLTFNQAQLHLYPGPAPPLSRPSSTFIQAHLHLYPGPAPLTSQPCIKLRYTTSLLFLKLFDLIISSGRYNDECKFKENLLANNYNAYESAAYPGMYIGLSKTGKTKKGNRVTPTMTMTHFLPRI
ncbi:hypothetical protein VZT92_022973 [Zoarces viviparus]|uniref:Fibroblast growth factor n=1 Tax=Zoarces viviparus TaxID=48416 RepID=A0AAW1E741_ZOAVI